MHIITKKYLAKQARQASAIKQAAQNIPLSMAAMYPKAYSILGDPGMYGIYSNYSPDSQYINAVAPNAMKDALYGGVGGIGASIALQGIKDLSMPKILKPIRATAGLGGAVLGGLLGLGLGTGQYLAGKYLTPTGQD